MATLHHGIPESRAKNTAWHPGLVVGPVPLRKHARQHQLSKGSEEEGSPEESKDVDELRRAC